MDGTASKRKTYILQQLPKVWSYKGTATYLVCISIIINFIPKDYWGDMYNCVIGPKDNLFDNQDEYDYNDGYMMC